MSPGTCLAVIRRRGAPERPDRLPPACVGVEEVDLLHDEGPGRRRASRAGGTRDFVVVAGAAHGFVHTAPKATATIDYERRIGEFLQRYLAPAAIKSS